jgi:hypothetical protein
MGKACFWCGSTDVRCSTHGIPVCDFNKPGHWPDDARLIAELWRRYKAIGPVSVIGSGASTKETK